MAHILPPPAFFAHPQVLAVGEDASSLHLRAILWSNEYRTDGSIPTGALDAITRRSDAGDLVLRLVAAGLWTVGPAGWVIASGRRERLSAIRAEAGRKGGLRSSEVRAGKQTKQPATGLRLVPCTVHASAPASEPSESESDQETQKATTAFGRESAQQAAPAPQERQAVVVAALPPDPEGQRILAALAAAAGDAFDASTSSAAMRADLAARLGAQARALDDVTVARMASLCATPKLAWPWATALGTGPVTVAWLLGKKGGDGIRTGRPLLDLISKAHALVAADRRAQQARQREAEQIAAMRERQANAPQRAVIAKGHFAAFMAARSQPVGQQMAQAS